MKKARYFVTCITALLALTGCGPETKKPLLVCPGKSSIAEALSALQSKSENMVSLYARGKSRLLYYDENGKKHKENLDVKIIVKSSDEIYLQGDMSIVPKAIMLGSNKYEFWLAIKPKEISEYWWGQWPDLDSSQDILINPKTLLEALGIVKVDLQADWSLSNKGPFDILTKRVDGVIIKKIYIYCCDYTIRKIEYFDLNGQVLACTELNEYKEITENFFVPSFIEVTTYGSDKKEDTISFTFDLNSIQHREITASQNRYFERPAPQGYKNLHRLENGNWIAFQQ
jgi:hypothetical protein